MKIPARSTLPAWLSTMRGGSVQAELTVSEFLPRDFAAFCRILNPARSSGGIVARWQDIADASTRVAGHTQWHAVADQPQAQDLPRLDPVMGGLDHESAVILGSILGEHTRSANSIYYLAWDGYVGLGEGYRASETVLASYGRDMHVLQGSIADAGSSAATGMAGAPLWWIPVDGSWCVGNDIYARSVYVGGSEACIQEILADPRLESYPVPAQQKVVAEDN